MTFVTAKNSTLVARRWTDAAAWAARLDPRNSIGAATAWLIGAVSLGLALAAAAWVTNVAGDTLFEQRMRQLNQYAERLSSQLDITLYAHLQSVRATAAMLGAAGPPNAGLGRFLEELQRTLPEFAWVGYADTQGRLVAVTDAASSGTSVALRPWFSQGLRAPWIADVQEPGADPSRPVRYIALTAPVTDPDGRTLGVLGVQMSRRWADQLKRRLDAATHPGGFVQTFILDHDGEELLGPDGASGRSWRAIADPEHYLEAQATGSTFARLPALEWTVRVREPRAQALARVGRLRTEIFAILFGLGMAAALLGAFGASRLLRRIGLLAAFADTVRAADGKAFAPLQGRDEAARIGHTLTGLIEQLQRDKLELQVLNADLDARVAARTREVERLSEENQYAAVVRERLRIARELHDTLAHSMMAMLTQIRLLRRFVDTNPGALREELARAEEAAQSGLDEARAAIAQMRYNAVRDTGLGSAVAALVGRFEQRTGIETAYRCEPRAGAVADARAETVFRMIEELLHNVERHAQAEHVCLELAVDANTDALRVSVADDGIGFDPNTAHSGHHYGLRGLREQATLIGATLRIASSARGGSCATIVLPLSLVDRSG